MQTSLRSALLCVVLSFSCVSYASNTYCTTDGNTTYCNTYKDNTVSTDYINHDGDQTIVNNYDKKDSLYGNN